MDLKAEKEKKEKCKETKYGGKEKSISIKIGTKCGRKGKNPKRMVEN